ncbi:uncharacterized protein LOC122520979 [Polistes fuscatus]|uniref:uncharacterized protein LOC122520979 n=1 Tax=Polistes fuscatus TaxID=30207 RepID=UPI001CA9FFA0|nr:uncharacterized protein LOC122520979 [Polistes fuscatus]XP_043497268.1 uncharacterized protein LOC122520979 [Polistes fuscatus]XP_043497269.1 uncharacterized protein LOC122520979 [Polistes fuscatus]XP_043497270.1 uncharacterized protein LOC122520979 [Polistes fuscatus]XP_043497271.1 uncharacterized protein LOC122520979 [Polistes fuscatus]XP_043497272.1 uncharacterized protein LOC122520979 [Polistes fuscatus]XP_043497274.1 uncharacterized protein LOC122520979 [Polistes fuscatus]XP_04349727
MAKTRANYHHHRTIVIKAVLLFLVIGETNSQVNFFDERKFDRPLFPSWYNQSALNARRLQNFDDRIYFADEDIILPTCQNEIYCEDVPNYPEEFVKAKLRTTKGIFGVVDILINKTDDFAVRTDDNEVSLCVSLEKIILPKSAKSVKGEWLFIVQNGKEFAQAVRIEVCMEDSQPCRFFNEEYKAVCEQTYIYRELVAVKDNNLKSDLFRFPANCCCNIKKT